MANFDYSVTAESAIKVYDNEGAYNTLMDMMNRKEQLNVKFYTSKDKIPCAWIESKHVAGFKFQLKTASFHGLLNYLFNGIVDDFDENPAEYDSINENDDFQTKVMQMLINSGKVVQFVPFFREKQDKISGTLPCYMGKIMFRIKRTVEIVDELREAGQFI